MFYGSQKSTYKNGYCAMNKHKECDAKCRNVEEHLANSYTESTVNYLYNICVERSLESNNNKTDELSCLSKDLNDRVDIGDLEGFCRKIINESFGGMQS